MTSSINKEVWFYKMHALQSWSDNYREMSAWGKYKALDNFNEYKKHKGFEENSFCTVASYVMLYVQCLCYDWSLVAESPGMFCYMYRVYAMIYYLEANLVKPSS